MTHLTLYAQKLNQICYGDSFLKYFVINMSSTCCNNSSYTTRSLVNRTVNELLTNLLIPAVKDNIFEMLNVTDFLPID